MSDYVPEEVVIQILVRLPARQVSECRRVCKQWQALINDHSFIAKYTQSAIDAATNNENPHRVILRLEDSSDRQAMFSLNHDGEDSSFTHIKEFNLPFDQDHKHGSSYDVIGMCLGLVCLLGHHHHPQGFNLSKSVIVWNPSLGSCVRIMFQFSSNLFESTHGFGFDPQANDYKIVRIVCRKRTIFGMLPRPNVQVFALKEGIWKNVAIDTEAVRDLCKVTVKTPQAYVNGTLHWIGCTEMSGERRLVLVAFNMSEETITELKIPDELKTEEELTEQGNENVLIAAAAIDQKLALMYYFTQWRNSPSHDGCCIWTMNEYGKADSWTLQYRIDLRLGLGKMVGMRRNGEMLLVTRFNEELVSFNTINAKFQGLGVYGDVWSFYLDTYMESLGLMRRIDGALRMTPTPDSIANASSSSSSVERTRCDVCGEIKTSH